MDFEFSATAVAKYLWRKVVRNAGPIFLLVASIICTNPNALAQINCASGSSSANKLGCLIPSTVTPSTYTFLPTPTATTVNSQLANSFGFLTSDIGGEISQIPLASPASGVIFVIDPTLKVPVPSDQSLGPILTQRADTIGRHKIYVATTYQYFLLKDVDGLALNNLPSAFFFSSTNSSTPDTLGVANGHVDLKVHQFVGYVTFGLTSSTDISVAVPVLRVQMRYTDTEVLYNLNNSPPSVIGNPVQNSKAAEATGIGDIVLAFKQQAWKGKHFGVSFGAEARLPTGDAENFLGSGTFGIKPFATLTRSGKISPHFNFAYQFNGNSKLVTNAAGNETRLPDRLIYSGGADWGILRRVTIAADILEQRVLSGQQASLLWNPRIFPSSSSNSATVPSAISTVYGSSYNRTDGSIGIKVKPFGNVIVSGNFLVKLDRSGLRERYAPLGGISFTY